MLILSNIERGALLRRGIALLPVLALLALTGCRTYYGYDDIVAEVRTPQPSGRPRDARYHAVLTIRDDNTTVRCFQRHLLPRRTLVEKRIVGRKDYYANFEGDYYLDQPPYNWGWNRDAWLLPQLKFAIMNLGEPTDTLYHNPIMYLIPAVGQVFLAYDVILFAGGGCVDLCLFIGKSLCSGCTIAGSWLGGRCFGWTRDWELRQHKPGVLRMMSYMPFINLFCTFQTPPYMPMRYQYAHIYSEEEKFAPSDQSVLGRKIAVRLTPEQVVPPVCKVTARVFCDGEVCGSGEYTADGNGVVDLTELLRRSSANAPSPEGRMELELRLRDGAGAELLTRRVEFAVDQVMSRKAARDLRAYRDDGTDCLNKLLLSRRSHQEWRQELFGGEFAFPEDKK